MTIALITGFAYAEDLKSDSDIDSFKFKEDGTLIITYVESDNGEETYKRK